MGITGRGAAVEDVFDDTAEETGAEESGTEETALETLELTEEADEEEAISEEASPAFCAEQPTQNSRANMSKTQMKFLKKSAYLFVDLILLK